MTGDDLDVVARLVLMELSHRSFLTFAMKVREVIPGVSSVDLMTIWKKYMGMDGRAFPTHDIATGEPIRRST